MSYHCTSLLGFAFAYYVSPYFLGFSTLFYQEAFLWAILKCYYSSGFFSLELINFFKVQPLRFFGEGLGYGNMLGFTTVMKIDTHVRALGWIGISDHGFHATFQERPLVLEI
jgi:hypothetical protein